MSETTAAGGVSLAKIVLGVGCGVMLGLVVMMAACSMIVGKAALDVDSAMKEERAKKLATLAAIKIKNLESETSSGYVTIRGKACNEGAEPATFVKIGFEYLNASGNVVDSDFAYASSSEPIQPGACKEFMTMQRNSDDWVTYRARVAPD